MGSCCPDNEAKTGTKTEAGGGVENGAGPELRGLRRGHGYLMATGWSVKFQRLLHNSAHLQHHSCLALAILFCT